MQAQFKRPVSSIEAAAREIGLIKLESFSNRIVFLFFSPKRIQVHLFIQWLKNKVSKFCFESELSASLHWIFKCIWLFIISFSFNHVYAFGNCPGCYNLFCMANIQIELCISIFLKLNFCAVHPYSQLKRPTPLLYTYMSH